MKGLFSVLALATGVLLGAPLAVRAQVLTANFNTTNGGFAAGLLPGSTGEFPPNSWTYGPTAGVGASNGAWFVNNFEASATIGWIGLTLTSPVLSITATGSHQFSFDQRFSFEPSWDGGQLQVSVNGGNFVTVANAAFTTGGYTGTINSSYPGLSLIGGQQAWTGESAGYGSTSYVTSTATMAFTAGDSIQFRFLGVWDSRAVGANPGWVIDNVSVTVIPELPAIALGAMAALIALGHSRRLRNAWR